MSKNNTNSVTVLSSFPPLRGMSKYSAALVRGIPKDVNIEALGFKHMYPKVLYPTNTTDHTLKKLDEDNVVERSFMTWYNPLTWLYAGAMFKGRVLHVQWWHFFLAPMFATIMLCARLRRKPIITTVHNVSAHERARAQSIADKIIYALSNEFIVHTEPNKSLLSKKTNKPINIIPHGVLKPDAAMTGVTKSEARKLLGLSSDDKVVLFFGIIREYKGLDILIRSFSEVIKNIPEAKLVIAGKPWTGEGWTDYQALINNLELNDFVLQKIGFVPEAEIEPLFVAADLVAFPYKKFDAQSGAASLALHFSKAMIVSDVGGLPELVKNESSIVRPNNTRQLVQALVRALADENYRSLLEKQSQILAKELSWTAIGVKTGEVYSKLLAN